MKESGWSCFVSYQPEIPQALADLRHTVFADKAYQDQIQMYEFLLDDQFAALFTPETHQDLVSELESLQQRPQVTDIADLLSQAGTLDTRSVLDMPGLGRQASMLVVAPLTDQELLDLFGTTKPTHEMVEEKIPQIQSLRPHWQGTYIIVYAGNRPREICFAGRSGL